MTDAYRARHVLVFDSGLGGLSVLAEIKRLLPAVTTSYLSDSGGFPYGNKSAQFVVDRCQRVLSAFTERHPVDVIVVACNTASTLALPILRSSLPAAIVGVVPAIKPAALVSKSGYIGLLATPATVKRRYTHKLIQEFADHCHIVTCGSTALVHLAEKKLHGETIDPQSLAIPLSRLMRRSPANPAPEEMDTLVLACTHFPLLRDEIATAFDRNITLLDSGEAIARRVAYCLEQIPQHARSLPRSNPMAWFTGPEALSPALLRTLLEFELEGSARLLL